MCGIIGQVNLQEPVEPERFEQGLHSLSHRGPEDYGTYYSNGGRVAFGHRRLSFLDLTVSGRQPMASSDGNIVLTFNGEIYNYRELREQLRSDYSFCTSTDTEVLIAAYLKWGMGFLNRTEGMFALGILDKRVQTVFLARDRFGIKPLYFAKRTNSFLFASEPRAILKASGESWDVDFSAMADFFVYRYVPSPKSIWKNMHKLPPAHYLEMSTVTLSYRIQEYWVLSATSKKLCSPDLQSAVGNLLADSVKRHLRSDVPIGAFLSGGYDSSALIYYMKLFGKRPTTFTIGFRDWERSEDNYARTVSNHLNVLNLSRQLDASSLSLVDNMAAVYDEPIADISIVPTYAVSELARSKVKAVFSGEGADELFGGYTWQHEFYQKSHPKPFTDKLRAVLSPPDAVEHYASAMAMGEFNLSELRRLFTPDIHQYLNDDIHWFYKQHYNRSFGPVKSIQYLDIKTFMAELVLTKVDRASMFHSLEVRVPFLSRELFELIFSLDEQQYLRPEQTKYLLFKNIESALPEDVLKRKKQGFVGPDSYYMNRQWYSKELSNSSLVKAGIVNRSYINQLLKEDYTWKLWKILIMDKWFSFWVGG
ncbi:MAG: asparagine synthase (glutamine-hydrolyzing) [Flavobacteriales bacterium]|nr:asparagine synthase (glutamine-hydrolyzing) [Flavobacteriales bacterium]MCB9205111.1 asparagine synthase (glutamine-hydrolyzing) [Flavobacteriales bacterium]